MQRKGLISKTKTEIKNHVLSKSQSSSFRIVKKLFFFSFQIQCSKVLVLCGWSVRSALSTQHIPEQPKFYSKTLSQK